MLMIAFAWCFLPIRYLLFLFDNLKNKRRLRNFLDSITTDRLSYSVHIDEEKITTAAAEWTCHFPWTEFSQFGVHQETLYVFNDVRAIDSLYWDQNEIGNEAFSALLELVQSKTLKQTF